MGGENSERKYGLEVEQGTWRIRINQEMWELYTYLDSSTHYKEKTGIYRTSTVVRMDHGTDHESKLEGR